MPSAREWRGETQAPSLREVIPGQMWRVHADFPMTGTPFATSSIATLVRTDDAALAFINPVQLSDALCDEVRALGRVRVIASQGRAHSRYVEPARKQFPEASVLGSQGHRQHPQAAHIRFDGLLAADCPLLPTDLEALPVEGTIGDEVALLHHPTRTLIVQDLLANNRRDNDTRSFGGRMYYFAFGLCDRIGLHAYQLMLWRDLPAFQRGLARIANAPYERVTAAHWRIDPSTGAEVDAFREALLCLVALSPSQKRRMLLRYAAHQPGFILDLLRYKRAQRKLASASLES